MEPFDLHTPLIWYDFKIQKPFQSTEESCCNLSVWEWEITSSDAIGQLKKKTLSLINFTIIINY